MKYVALLRGINVGGNTLIKMADLKAAVEKAGFTNVMTYIASGNLLFETKETGAAAIEKILEQVIHQTFHLPVRVVVLNDKQYKKVLDDVPESWKTRGDIRCYIAFLKRPTTAAQVMKEVQPKEGIDVITPGTGAVYMATLLSGLTKSGINKIIGKKIYQDMTMRNYNTSKKLLELLEK